MFQQTLLRSKQRCTSHFTKAKVIGMIIEQEAGMPKLSCERQTALERLQAARAGRGEDRSVEIERNVESAGADLTEQDRERQRGRKHRCPYAKMCQKIIAHSQ